MSTPGRRTDSPKCLGMDACAACDVPSLVIAPSFVKKRALDIPGAPERCFTMAEQWKTDFDQRQFASMAEHLRRYEHGEADLGSLIAGLEALLLCLEGADENWKAAFRREWGILEEVYAVRA